LVNTVSEYGGKFGSSVGRSIAAYRAALSFLTALPVHIDSSEWMLVSVRALRWYPVVGATIGTLVAVAGLASLHLFGSLPAAAIMVAAEGLVTGGLHWDGLSDSADALFSRRPVEDQLEIMRDSRLGTFGAAALFVDLLLKFSLYATLLGSPFLLPLAVAGHTVSRGVLPHAIVRCPYARDRGLGTSLQTSEAATREIPWAVAATVALLAAAVLVSLFTYDQGFDSLGLAPAVLAFVLVAAGVVYWATGRVADRISNHLDGLTGDVYGGIAELAFILFMLLCTAGLRLARGGFIQ